MDLHTLQQKCEVCEACELSKTRTNCVFGAGSETAKVLFVGEAPGEQEDLTGTPFVGRAGKLLNACLAEVGILRDEIYIANILKCRPPHNRDPLPAQEDACIGFLEEQIRLIDPAVIVCLGRISAMRLIKKDLKITKEHGIWFEKDGRRMMVIYHPAFVLRDPRKKGDFTDDLRKVRAFLFEKEL